MTKNRWSALLLWIPIFAGCAEPVLRGKVETAEKNEQAVRVELAESQKRLLALGGENQRLLEQVAAAGQERAKNAEQLADMNAQITQRADSLEKRCAELIAENGRLTEENRRSQERIAYQNASLTRTPTEIIVPNRGKTDIPLDFGDPLLLEPRRCGDTIIIELQDRLLFDPNDGKLTSEGKKRLATVARTLLAERSPSRIRIDAHTAFQVDTAAGHGASFAKGKQVFDFLVGERIVPAERISLTSSGVSSPILAAAADAAAQRNSRIELILE